MAWNGSFQCLQVLQGFQNSLVLIFYTAVFTHFSLFFDVGCYNVASEISNVATGNGHDHITQAQGQLDGLYGADTDQSGR